MEKYSTEEDSKEALRKIDDASFYPFAFYHLIREVQRGHISFEKLRSEVVPWAKRILLENEVDITRGEMFNIERSKIENAGPISTEKPVARRHISKEGKLLLAENPEDTSAT